MVHLSDQFKIFVVFDERSVFQNVYSFFPCSRTVLDVLFQQNNFFSPVCTASNCRTINVHRRRMHVIQAYKHSLKSTHISKKNLLKKNR